MGLIVVERSFELAPIFEELEEREKAVAWCFEQYRVQALRSFLSLDGRRAVCLYRAPDVEAVRSTQREAGLPFERAWSAQAIEQPPRQPPPGHSAVVVQRKLAERATPQRVDELAALARDCMNNHRAHLHGSYLAADGVRMVCHYDAPDAESVRVANHQSGLPVESVWSATLYGP